MSETRQIRVLTDLALNEPASVARMKLPDAEIIHLGDLGMRVGSTVRVLQASKDEPLLVAVGDGRIAVNYSVAQKIYVY
ncbi:FeoA family protein [Sutterella sp.]|uniref:FeoA family protein n=1 Tax=Sutterella sp. TaxID=1981025 RepID=UPI0026DFF6FF|nr:FeoA family protein [Sutterella sp.]MDO5532937.1 FeoA family protein [Sutterella sp.]